MKNRTQPESRDPLREWRESAPYWAKHRDMVRAMFAPITSALIEAISLKAGDSVLDVAGGSGEPSITIAEALDRSTSIVFTDAVAEMVGASRGQARLRRLTNIVFAQCVGEALPFLPGSFDVVVCRLGLMLFPDADGAIREMLRVAKAGGRIAAAVWAPSDSNPLFHVVAGIVSRYVESPPEDPDAPGAFRFAPRGKLASLFRRSGAIDVNERVFDFTIEAPMTPREFWTVRSELSDTLRGKVAALSPEQVSRLAQEVEAAGHAFYENGLMRFPARVLIVSGNVA